MRRSKVLVVTDHRGEEWASPLVDRLDRLGARAASLTEADAVAVVLHRVGSGGRSCALTLKGQHTILADVRKALSLQIPVTPLLGGCHQVDNVRLQLPGSIEDLRFRIAVALPNALAVPEVTAQLIASAIRARSQPPGKGERNPPSIRKPAMARFSLLSSLQQTRRHESVFISYRRDDTAHWAGELAKTLSMMLGPQRVFFDVGSGAPGLDFRSFIDGAMAKSSVVALVIGKFYLSPGGDGLRRIDDEYDWVRTELRAAIASGKPLRVVLVGSALFPAPSDLPPDIRALTDATVVGTIRTGGEISRILAGILSATRMGEMLDKGLKDPGGVLSSFRDDLSEAWRIAAVREGLFTLGWALEKEVLAPPQRLFHACYPSYRFEVIGGERIVVLEERTSNRWKRRTTFSITGAALGHTGVMQLEPRLVEAAVDPGAFLDRTGRKSLPSSKPEWPGGLDPLHYSLGRRELLPITIEAWNDTRRYLGAGGGLKQLAQGQNIALKEGITGRVAFMPCGKRIVVTTGNHLEMIDVSNGERIPSHEQTRRCSWTAMDVSGDGHLALGSFDGRITICDANLQPRMTLSLPRRWLRGLTATVKRGLPNQILSLSWSSSQEYIAAATESEVWILDVAAKAFTRFRYPLGGEHRGFGHYGARFMGKTDNLLIHADLGDIWIVNARTCEVRGRLEPVWRPDPEWKNDDVSDVDLARRSLGIIRAAVTSVNGNIIALAGSDGQVGFTAPAEIMHVDSICAWHKPTVTTGNDVQDIAFNPRDNRLAVVASDSYLVIGDVDHKRPVTYVSIGASLAFTQPSIAWAPDGKRVALIRIQHRNQLFVWNLDDDAAPQRTTKP